MTTDQAVVDGLLTRVEAMALLRVGKETFNQLINHPKRGQIRIPSVMFCGRRMYPKAGLLAWLAAHTRIDKEIA